MDRRDQQPNEAPEPDVPDVDVEADLVPEIVEISMAFTKDAVQMAKGGCRKWK